MRVMAVLAMLLMLFGIASAETGAFSWPAFDFACGTLTYSVEYVSAAGETTHVGELPDDGSPDYMINILDIDWGEYIMRVTGTVLAASGETYTDNCETPVCVGGVQANGCAYSRTGD